MEESALHGAWLDVAVCDGVESRIKTRKALKISRVLVSQPRPTSSHDPYVKLEQSCGVDIEYRPLIHVEGVTAFEFRKQRIDFSKFQGVVFNSKVAVDHFFRLCTELRYQVPDTLLYFCISESVALYLQKYVTYRKRRVFSSSSGKMEDVLPEMLKRKEEKFLFPVSNVQGPEQLRELKRAGLHIKKAILYNTVSSDIHDLDLHSFDMIVFYSPFGIASLLENFPEFVQKEIKIAVYGKGTHRAAKQAGLAVDVVAPTAKCPSLTDAIEEFICSYNKEK